MTSHKTVACLLLEADNEEEFESGNFSSQDDVIDGLKQNKQEDDVKASICESFSSMSMHEHAPVASDVSKSNNSTRVTRSNSNVSNTQTGSLPNSPKQRRRVVRAAAREAATSSLAPRVRSHDGSVQAALLQFTTAELLTGTNKFGCETCTKQKHSGKGEWPIYWCSSNV